MKKIFLSFLLILSSITLFSQELNPENLVLKEDLDSSSIENLKCNLTFENLYTKTFYGDEFTIEIYCNNSIKTPQITKTENTLIISSTKQKATIGDKCTIMLYIPKKHTFNSITITSTSGSITLSEINSQDFIKINGNSGNISISDSNTSYLQAKTQSASICVQNQALDYFDLTSGSGSITANFLDAPFGKSSLKTTTGNITIRLPSFADYNIEAHTKTGLLWNFEEGTQENARQTIKRKINDGGTVIVADSSSGNIYLQSE